MAYSSYVSWSQAGWLEISVSVGGRLDLWLLGCVLLPCAPFAAIIITSRCSQETQVGRKKCLQPRGQTIEVLWDLANPLFFDAIFKFVLFWIGDFADVEVECFNTTEELRRFLNDLGFLQDDCTYTASVFQTLCTRPYSTTRSSYHSISLWTCWKTLFATSHLLEPFLFQNQKKTNQPPSPNNNTSQQQKYLFLVASFGSKVISKTSKVLTFSCIDTLLGLSGPALCLCFTLVPHRTTKLTEGGEWGKGWRWMAHRGVCFENKLLWSGRGNLEYFKITHLIVFFGGVFVKKEWVLASCLESTWTHNEADVSTYSRTFLPVLSFSSRLRTLHTGQYITNHHKLSYHFKKKNTPVKTRPPTKFSKWISTSFRERNPKNPRLCVTELCPQ